MPRSAVALASAAGAEQGIEVDLAANDSAETFVERVRALPPAQLRALVQALGGIILALIACGEALTQARAFAAASAVFSLALAVYALRSAVADIDEGDDGDS